MGPDSPLFDDRPLPVGEHVRILLEAKRWTQDDLAGITGYSRSALNELIVGKTGITLEMAIALAGVFGTTPEHWVLLDTKHRLSLTNQNRDGFARWARVYDYAPVKDMQKRGWIKSVKSPEEIEVELRKFFNVESLDALPEFPLAARKSAPLADLTPAQRAWCFRVRQLAKAPPSNPFDPSKMPKAEAALRRLAAYPGESSRVAEVLSKVGIRFVVVEPIAAAKIDGCAFWLDPDSPVIGLSLRFDRIDFFWFTLMHEWAHIKHGDCLSVDTDLHPEVRLPTLLKDEIERRADAEAANAMIPSSEIESFVRRVGPLYSKQRIVQFAHTMKIHPGIIVGQLQHRGEIGYRSNREMLAKVRVHVVESCIADGWKQTISPDGEDG